MKQMLKLTSIAIIIFLAISCDQKPKFDYKYADKEQVLTCTGVDDKLLNEALYAFEDDLLFGYGLQEKILSASYGRFLYSGFSGTAGYPQFTSNHALEIKKALIAEGIIIEGGAKSNLNYDHPAVRCIVNKIEDKELAATINALIDTGTMNPKLFNGRMRNFGLNAEKNRYEALYVALDTFYQQLTVARPSESVNE